ncbi:melanoma antigen preferentially expressed in tumors-like [Trachypithecus francoisi]|uniref:melanoma antigen preferentially expressed in tumors-like n=1 Tax=Trachypithecus francoisi TaxID=54180 RepID=UPI00141B8510|nr:melanoma antigen preferentially expressed in tumors-like [Trachypithecus francoisi]
MLELETIREVRLHHRSRSCFVSDLIQFFTQKLLETLVVNGYRLTENDITYLSQSIHATQLKELVLCSHNLSEIVPGPLEFLLSEVSGTLQHLNLRNCKLKEAQIRALLPALCCCSHLRSLIFHHNVISTSGIMNVLQHLAGLKELKHVQYPVSAECVVYLDGYRWENLNRVELASVQTLQQADMELINSTSSLTYENAQLT